VAEAQEAEDFEAPPHELDVEDFTEAEGPEVPDFDEPFSATRAVSKAAKQLFIDFPAGVAERADELARQDPAALEEPLERALAITMRRAKDTLVPSLVDRALRGPASVFPVPAALLPDEARQAAEAALPPPLRELEETTRSALFKSGVAAIVDPLNALFAGLTAARALQHTRQLGRKQFADAVLAAARPKVMKELEGLPKSVRQLKNLDVVRRRSDRQTYRVVKRVKEGFWLEHLQTGRQLKLPRAGFEKDFEVITLNRARLKDAAEDAAIETVLKPAVPASKLTKLMPPEQQLTPTPSTLRDRLARGAQPLIVVERAIMAQGPTGRRFAELLKTARSRAERRAGQAVEAVMRPLRQLPKAQRIELTAALNEGQRLTSSGLRDVYRSANSARREIARESVQGGLLVKLRSGAEVPFAPRRHYFPHLVPSITAAGEVIDDAIANAVRMGHFGSLTEARAAWTEYVGLVQRGRRADRLAAWLVKHGQARNLSDAHFKLQRYVARNARQRSRFLERAREIDLPFWDPDPLRVLPEYYLEAFRRLEQVKAFGPQNELAKDLIHQISLEGGDASFVRLAFERIMKPPVGELAFGKVPPNVQQAFKTFNIITKMGLSAILNAPQGLLNSFVKAGVVPTIKGLKDAATAGGQNFALRSGTILETVTREMGREAGGASRAAQSFLKRVGFNATERFNRTLSANTARHYLPQLLGRLKQNARDQLARREFTRLGLNADEVLKRGHFTEAEVLEASNRFTNLTQFRSGVQDLPYFASSPEGRLMFQFKSFVTGFTRFITDSLLLEARRGNLRPLTRFLVAGGLTGEAVRDVVDSLRANPRPENLLTRYLENLGTVGGIGIFSELWQAAMVGQGGGILSLIAGPTLDELADLLANSLQAASGRPAPLMRQLTREVPLVGPTVRNVLMPSEQLQRERTPAILDPAGEGFEGFPQF
jgi:hypothetical protein